VEEKGDEKTLSIVPYREAKTRPRRRTLDRPQVVRAALTLLDEVGLEALTMRRLSAALGIQAASLYRHVKDKDELLQLLADEIAGEIPIARSSAKWRDSLKEEARNARKGLLGHRDAAQLLANTMPFGPKRLRHIEEILQILRSAGFTGRDAVRASYHFNNLVTEFVADESRFSSFAGTAAQRRKLREQALKYFKSLSKDEFPVVIELADYLVDDDQDALFEFGMEVWLRGLEGLLKR
jgi:TetR/AcrR family tetracycline transcriptional repressor